MPTFKHDCDNCQFLGQTIGGGKIFDLYAHRSNAVGITDATLIARYSDDGPDYYSTFASMARPTGHAELFCAAVLWQRLTVS